MARKQQKERSNAVRQMILDAAQEIANEQGLERLTVRNIGERIGYSTGVVYYHFENKQDIVDALHVRRDEEAYEHVASLVSDAVSFRENTRAIMSYIATLAYEKKEAYYRLFSSRRRPGEKYAHEIWLKLATVLVENAVKNGEIENCDIEKKANCMLGFFLGFDMLYLEFCPTDKQSTLETVDMIVDIIMDGMK